MTDTPRTPAAFINAIAEEGTKAEAVEWLQKIWDERCQLQRELTEARADAERYRWLRSHHRSEHDMGRLVWYLPIGESLNAAGLDAALDAARGK